MRTWFKKRVKKTHKNIKIARKNNAWLDNLFLSINRFNQSNLTSSAAAASYYFLFSLFPLILFAISLLNYIDPTLAVRVAEALPELDLIIPSPVMELILSFVNSVGQTRSVSLLSFSGIGLLWSASSALSNIVQFLNRIYNRKSDNDMNPIIQRVIGVILALLFGVLLILILFFLSFSDLVFNFLEKHIPIPNFIKNGGIDTSKYLVAFFLLLFIFLAIYASFSRKAGKFWHKIISASFTSLMWLVISYAISNILVGRGRYDFIYGSLSSIIFLMLWMYLAIFGVLLGAFLNVELISYYEKKSVDSDYNNENKSTEVGTKDADD